MSKRSFSRKVSIKKGDDGRKRRYEKHNAVKALAERVVTEYGTVGSKIFLEDFKNYLEKKSKG
jgi:hypothetical protein